MFQFIEISVTLCLCTQTILVINLKYIYSIPLLVVTTFKVLKINSLRQYFSKNTHSSCVTVILEVYNYINTQNIKLTLRIIMIL